MANKSALAPGTPGSPPHWAPGAKSGVGTARSHESPVWFTLSRGVLTEVFYPFVDTANTRELQLLVADGRDFVSAEKSGTRSEVSCLKNGVPAYHLVNTCLHGRYRIEKVVLTDPHRPVVLQQIQFTPLLGKLGDYSVCVQLNPHLGNRGAGNTARVGDYKGEPMLFARRGDAALALACSVPWRKRSAGFAGTSDGWQDLSHHKRMEWGYDRAENGNVALTGEVDLEATKGRFVLALGFGRDEGEAGHRARASLLTGFESARHDYVRGWSEWRDELLAVGDSRQDPHDLYGLSAAVMRIHEGKSFAGGIVASLAVPWGFAKGDDDMGYHLVWPRDMIQTVGGLLAVRKHVDARRVLLYFQVTQEADGHWPQNMRLDGRAWWDGIQLDEMSFVILLVGLARREGALDDAQLKGLWPMVRRAAGYLIRHGPATPMDRWEEEAGYFASTLAVEVPALLVAAELAEAQGEADPGAYLRETADCWNAAIESLLYVRGTDRARRAGVDGYYVRFALPNQMQFTDPAHGEVVLKNHPQGTAPVPLAEVVSPDALALVRFGLRAADDPRIVNTVKVIDGAVRVETPRGPGWHRYSHDGYGEHADGAPFDGAGIGRIWPLLTGERAHYELAAGRRDEAERLLHAMERLAGDSGLLPEQVWDTDDIPERELHFGRPSGSAMPLVWAHAEYVKLRRSLHDGAVFDRPAGAYERYVVKKTGSPFAFWRFTQQRRALAAGKVLRLEVEAAAVVRWSADGWKSTRETPTRDTGLGMYVADLPTKDLAPGAEVVFTFHWTEADHWEGTNFRVAVQRVEPPEDGQTQPAGTPSAGKPAAQPGPHADGRPAKGNAQPAKGKARSAKRKR